MRVLTHIRMGRAIKRQEPIRWRGLCWLCKIAGWCKNVGSEDQFHPYIQPLLKRRQINILLFKSTSIALLDMLQIWQETELSIVCGKLFRVKATFVVTFMFERYGAGILESIRGLDGYGDARAHHRSAL